MIQNGAGMLRAGYAVRGTRYAVITKTKYRIPRSLTIKRQGLSNFTDKRLIFLCYNILRSLIHEPKQAHYACNLSGRNKSIGIDHRKPNR